MDLKTEQKINDDLLRPVFQTSRWFYVIVVLLGVIVLAGLGSWLYQMWFGLVVAGIKWPVYWAFYVTNFVFWSTQTGAYAPLFWTMVFCNFVIPFPLLAIRKLRTITGTVIASSTIVVGMWLERFLIVVPSLARKNLP